MPAIQANILLVFLFYFELVSTGTDFIYATKAFWLKSHTDTLDLGWEIFGV